MPLLTRAARAASRNRRENDAPGTPQKTSHSHKKGSPATSSPKTLLKKAHRRDRVFHIQQASKHRQILADRSVMLNIVRTHKTRHQLRFHPVVTGVCYLDDDDPSEDEDALDQPGNADGVHSLKAHAGSITFASSNEHQQQTYPRGILRIQRPEVYYLSPTPEDSRSQDDPWPQEARGRAGSRSRSLNSRSPPAPPPTVNTIPRSSSVDTERPHATRSRSTRSRPRLLVAPVDQNAAPELSSLSPTLAFSNPAFTADLAGVQFIASRTTRVADLSSDDSDDARCVYRSLFETPSLPTPGATAKLQSSVTVPCNATTSTHSQSVADCIQKEHSDESRRTDMTRAKVRLDARTSHANGARLELPRNRVDRVLLWFSLVYFPVALAMLGRIFGLV